CMPQKRCKANNFTDRNLPGQYPEKWKAFMQYCKTDVEVEVAIDKALAYIKISDLEYEHYAIDQLINDRGVKVDIELIKKAQIINEVNVHKLLTRMIDLTSLDNPGSSKQLAEWLSNELGEEIDSIAKDKIADLLKTDISETVREVLILRQQTSKTSIAKYKAGENYASPDNHRIRGLLQFYGAGRTGRWAGR